MNGQIRLLCLLCLGACLGGAGCSSSDDMTPRMLGDARVPQDAGTPNSEAGPGAPLGDAGVTPPLSDELTLEPKLPKLVVQPGQSLPTVEFTVLNARGARVDANFRVEDGTLGDITTAGVFTPTGTHAGATLIEAQVGRMKLSTELTIEVQWAQNGAMPDAMGGMPTGGYAGVGGEGPGGALEAPVRTALDGSPKSDAGLRFVYPYDRTVFPLGLLAPLLMWVPGTATAADGIRIHLKAKNFDYKGDFGRPPALPAGTAFVRHPIPQAVWEAATRSAAGGALEVALTVTQGGVVYGPIEQSWTIARGSLKGTVYYQSYGTNLAKNATGAIGGDGRFGGATLSIRLGAASPQLVAGRNGSDAECRVCHSVSSQGNRMTVQHGDQEYSVTSSIDLLASNAETMYPPATNDQLAWIGMTPDGALGLGNSEPLGVSGALASQLYDMTNGNVVTSSGLSSFVTDAAFPSFSHDGRKVAFNFFSGPGNAAIGAGDGAKLVTMDFDPMTRTFSNPALAYGQAKPAGWPGFTPTGNGLVYQLELVRGTDQAFFYTRDGSTGELWWTNLRTGMANALELANGTEAGTSYLPKGPARHDADHQLNYEPSVAPVASGGYAWMVFTSRRLYGNVATIDPWSSDPRAVDLSSTPTTKKLWIAALDLDVDTGSSQPAIAADPSHPAFYLPGQELLAGNARGFWVVDPCKDDGKDCESGVECCSGVCAKDAMSGKLTCGPKTNDCAALFGRCETAADCCDRRAACVNKICTEVLLR